MPGWASRLFFTSSAGTLVPMMPILAWCRDRLAEFRRLGFPGTGSPAAPEVPRVVITKDLVSHEAYLLAEADGFRQHPDEYWYQALVRLSTDAPAVSAP